MLVQNAPFYETKLLGICMLSVIWYSKVVILRAKQCTSLPASPFSSLQLFASLCLPEYTDTDISLRLLLGRGSLVTIHAFENFPQTDLLHLLTIKDVNPRQNTNTTKRCPIDNPSVFLKDDAGQKFQKMPVTQTSLFHFQN